MVSTCRIDYSRESDPLKLLNIANLALILPRIPSHHFYDTRIPNKLFTKAVIYIPVDSVFLLAASFFQPSLLAFVFNCLMFICTAYCYL